MSAAEIAVLLVDDQELFREGVRGIVDAQSGLRVVGVAGDGLEALARVEGLAPDVVLMDIRMPEMDGVEATRQIFAPERVGRRAAPVRVVVLTTFNLDDRAATAIRHGASGFLLKDTTPTQLAEAIRTVHAGNAVLAPEGPCGPPRPAVPSPGGSAAGVPPADGEGARGLHRGRPRAVEDRDRRPGPRR